MFSVERVGEAAIIVFCVFLITYFGTRSVEMVLDLAGYCSP